jgi:hypothetical protein
MLNELGVPPIKRSIHRHRADLESEPRSLGPSDHPLVVSIIAFGAVLAAGLGLAWLVL